MPAIDKHVFAGQRGLPQQDEARLDAQKWTTTQSEARKYLTREYRKPWKITV
jgi:hypothetical protein